MITTTSMIITQLIYICFLHWFADFWCQSKEMAENKHKSNHWLAYHTAVYSMVVFYGLLIFPFIQETINHFTEHQKTNIFNSSFWFDYIFNLFNFYLVTFICHFITDYFTSRLNTHFYQKGNTRGFFKSLGFDQFLHYTQLFLTWYFVVLK